MDTLPNEVLAKIIKQVPFKELFKVSTVSKHFYAVVHDVFKSITHLKMRLRFEDRYLADRVFILFKKEGSLTLQIEKNTEDYCDSLFHFISLRCPNLVVLDAPDLRINYQTLMKLAIRLKYFSFHSITGPFPQFFAKPQNFPNLMAFDITSHAESHLFDFFRCELIKADQGFIQRFLPAPDSFLSMPSTVRSVKISAGQLTLEHPIPQTLETLQTENTPLKRGTNFVNLKLLRVNCDDLNLGAFLSSVSQTKELMILSIKAIWTANLLQNLSQLLVYCKKIQYLYLEATNNIGNPGSLSVPVVPRLSYLRSNLPLTFSDSSHPSKLEHLYIRSPAKFESTHYDFANLSTLYLDSLAKRDLHSVLSSLSNCKSLKEFILYFDADRAEMTQADVVTLKNGHLLCSGILALISRPYSLTCKQHTNTSLIFEWSNRSGSVRIDSLPVMIEGKRLAMRSKWNKLTGDIAASFRHCDRSKSLSVSEVANELLKLFTCH